MKIPNKPFIRKNYTLSAKNASMGRLASRVALLLQGKDLPDYNRSRDRGNFVRIVNVEGLHFSGKKLSQKIHYRHSGHPGGLKSNQTWELFKKDPKGLFRKTVMSMLPKNTLRDAMIKRLTFINEIKEKKNSSNISS